MKPCEGDDEDLPEEVDSGFRTGENFEPKLEEVNEVEQESQKTAEVSTEAKAEAKTENVEEDDLKPMITKITINKKAEDEEALLFKMCAVFCLGLVLSSALLILQVQQ